MLSYNVRVRSKTLRIYVFVGLAVTNSTTLRILTRSIAIVTPDLQWA